MRAATRLGLVAGLGLFLTACVDDGPRGGGYYRGGYHPGYVSGPAYRGPVYYAPAPRRDWGRHDGRDWGRDHRRDDRRARDPGPPPRQGPPPRRENNPATEAFRDLISPRR